MSYEAIMKRLEEMEKRNEERFGEMDEHLRKLETNVKEMKNGIENLTSRMEIMEVKQNGLQSLYAGNSQLKSDLEYTTRNAGLGYNSRQQERIRKFL